MRECKGDLLPLPTFLALSPVEEGVILLSVILLFCLPLSTTAFPEEEDSVITGLRPETALVNSSGPCAQKVHATHGHSITLPVFLQTAHLDRTLLKAALPAPWGATSSCHSSLSASGQISEQNLLSALIIMRSVWRRRRQILPWTSWTRTPCPSSVRGPFVLSRVALRPQTPQKNEMRDEVRSSNTLIAHTVQVPEYQ